MSVHLDLLEKVLDLIDEAQRFPKRRTSSSGTQKGKEKGFIHDFERVHDTSHNPFSHASTLGPGPRGRVRRETNQWDCRKKGKYVQICTNTETGRKITVRVKKGWKKAYNAEYRDRKFPRRMDGKDLMSPKTAERIDNPPEEKPAREQRPQAGKEKAAKRKSPEASRQKMRHLKQKLAAVPTGGKKRRRGGGQRTKKRAAGVQGALPMEATTIREQLLMERRSRKSPTYWMRGLKIQKGALKKRYGLKPDETIPDSVWKQIAADKTALMKKSTAGTLTKDEKRHLKQIVLGMTFRRVSQAQNEERQTQLEQLPVSEETLQLLHVLREVLS